jgi:hypothetical protein
MGELTAEEKAEVERLEAEIAALDAEIEQRMTTTAPDPTRQMYFLRLDTKTVIQKQEEYDFCDKHHIPMRIVSYNSAVDHLSKEAAAKRKLKARRKHNKVARAQTRANRRKR